MSKIHYHNFFREFVIATENLSKKDMKHRTCTCPNWYLRISWHNQLHQHHTQSHVGISWCIITQDEWLSRFESRHKS